MDKRTEEYVLNLLRQGTVTWYIRTECLKKHRRRIKVGTYKNGNDKMLYEYQCQKCMGWFRYEEVEVDHIVEVGGFKGDFDKLIRRMYCSIDNLQPLCIPCHQNKTTSFNAANRFERKNKSE